MIWGCHTHWKTCFVVVVVVVVAMIFPTTEDYKHWKTCFVGGGFFFPETINTGRHIFVVVLQHHFTRFRAGKSCCEE